MYVYPKFVGEVHPIFLWGLKNNITYLKDVQQRNNVKKFDHDICLIARTFGMKTGLVRNAVKAIDAIIMLL